MTDRRKLLGEDFLAPSGLQIADLGIQSRLLIGCEVLAYPTKMPAMVVPAYHTLQGNVGGSLSKRNRNFYDRETRQGFPSRWGGLQ